MKYLIFILLLSYLNVFSQTFYVYDIDASAHPKMRAKFLVFDENNEAITDLDITDLKIKENGITRDVTYLSCPNIGDPAAVSLALSFDISSSMLVGPFDDQPISLSKLSAIEICDLIELPPSEIAIQICNENALLLNDFISNRNDLKKNILNVFAEGNNDFEEQLINSVTGLLNIAKEGENIKAAVLYTDAWWESLPSETLQECINICQENDIQFYAVIFSPIGVKTDGIKRSLEELALASGGALFDGIDSDLAAKQVALQIQTIIQNPFHCEVEWKSEISCDETQISLEIEIPDMDLLEIKNYEIDDSLLAYFEFSPSPHKFVDPQVGVEVSKLISVTARNHPIEVKDIIASAPGFDLKPKAFYLDIDESIDLTLSFTSTEEKSVFCQFDLINDECDINYYASAIYGNDANNTLKLVYPNGNEKFRVRTDELIRWEGIDEEEVVQLEYSIDNGINWTFLSYDASNLEYNWENIPNKLTDDCLVRVSQLDYAFEQDPRNPSPILNWKSIYGGSNTDIPYSVASDGNEFIYVAGLTNSTDRFITEPIGDNDLWLVKINGRTGQLIWEKTYGGTKWDDAKKVLITSDGKLIVAGTSESTIEGYIDDPQGYDFWVTKIEPGNGDIIWMQVYGGSNDDHLEDITETKDGKLIMTGGTKSFSSNNGAYDVLVIKAELNNGDMIWQRNYGGNYIDRGYSILERSNGEYAIAGFTNSYEGNIISQNGEEDILLLNIEPENGDMLWYKTYGASDLDFGTSMVQTNDNDLVLSGYTKSFDGIIKNKGGLDQLVIKVNSDDGELIWHKVLGGEKDDLAYSLLKNHEGNIIVLGSMASVKSEFDPSTGAEDLSMIMLSQLDGNVIWHKIMGGTLQDVAFAGTEISPGNYCVVGVSRSQNGDVGNNYGAQDYWILKLSDLKLLQRDQSDETFSIVETESGIIDIDMGDCLFGEKKDSLVKDLVINYSSWQVNVDTLYFSGTDNNAFKLVSGFPPYHIDTLGTYFGEIRFEPTRVGIHNAQMNIVVESKTYTSSIIGNGLSSPILVKSNFIDFGSVIIGDEQVFLDTLLVTNISSEPIEITGTDLILRDDNEFEIISNTENFTLEAGQDLKASIKFKPTQLGRMSELLKVDFQGNGSPHEIQLFGNGVSGLLKVVDDSAYIGENKVIRIKVEDIPVGKLSEFTDHYEAKVKFQKTILSPHQQDIIEEIIRDTTFLNIEGQTLNREDLIEIPIKVGLGNVTESLVELLDIKFYDENNKLLNIDFTYEPGVFKVLGICEEGGSRLVDPDGQEIQMNISPNPSNSDITLTLSLIENGESIIQIYDHLGVKVFERSIIDQPGTHEFYLDINSFSTGIYYVNIQTPTARLSDKLIIGK